MDCKDLIVDGLSRVTRILDMSLKDLTPRQLTYRPSEQANSVAWLAWHLTRVQDHHLSGLAGGEQAWIASGWHTKFGKPADPQDTGQKYTSEQVAAIAPASAQLLLDYHHAVAERSAAYVNGLSCAEMDRELDEPQWDPKPTVGVRLVSVIADNTQHAGQVAYLRGLIEDRRWFPA